MELREYLKIFKDNQKTFWIIVVLFLLGGVLFQLFRPESYKVFLMLNVARSGYQETDSYQYDDFYRLQADEKFAETVVRWIGSPNVKGEICRDIEPCSEKIRARRLSAQMIQIDYVSKDTTTGKAMTGSIVNVINKEATKLNKSNSSSTWFEVVGSKPVIKKNKIENKKAFLIILMLGVFFGFWGMLFMHYFNKDENRS